MINIGDISKFTKIRFLYFSRGRLLTRVLTPLRLHSVSKRAFHNSVVSHRHKLRIESCRFREKLGDKGRRRNWKFVRTIERKTNGWKAGVNVSSDILVWVGESVGYKGVSCWFRVLRPIARVYTLRPFTTINHRANRGELRTTVIQPFNRFSLG